MKFSVFRMAVLGISKKESGSQGESNASFSDSFLFCLQDFSPDRNTTTATDNPIRIFLPF